MHHSGDNRLGGKGRDDEKIHLDLEKVSERSKELFITANMYTEDKTFEHVLAAEIRICASGPEDAEGFDFEPGQELCRYDFKRGLNTTGLVFAKFIRTGKKWSYVVICKPCGGRSATNEVVIDACKACEHF